MKYPLIPLPIYNWKECCYWQFDWGLKFLVTSHSLLEEESVSNLLLTNNAHFDDL